MRPHPLSVLPCLFAGGCADGLFGAAARIAGRCLCAFGIVLAIALSPGIPAPAADGPGGNSGENVDSRWLPWIGSWRMIADAADETGNNPTENYLLEIRPSPDGRSIVMRSFHDGKLLLETGIAADGSRQPLQDGKCSGWFRYSWSDAGKRLLFESEAGCPAEVPRVISGISVITDNRDWIDIQLLRSGEDRAVSVRKYRMDSGIQDDAAKTGRGLMGAPRFLAATSLSIDEVIELSRKIPSELLEAAIVELQRPFNINANTLKRLSSAGVQPRVVDLMVALSFPDKFTVNRQRITPVRETDYDSSNVFYAPPYVWLPFGYWSIYGPYSSWYWGTPIYGYWGGGWYGWPGYPPGHYAGRGDYGGGRLVNGRGYSKVEPGRPDAQPRYAQPRGNSGGNRIRYQSGSGSSSPPASYSGGGSSGSHSGGSGNSGGGSPSASPGGYHSGSGGSGTARPRD